MSNVIVVPNSRRETVGAMSGLVEAIAELEWTKAAYVKAVYMDVYDDSVPSPVRAAERVVAELFKGCHGFSRRNVARYRQRFDKTFPELKHTFGYGDQLDVTGLVWEPLHQPSTEQATLRRVIDGSAIDEVVDAIFARPNVVERVVRKIDFTPAPKPKPTELRPIEDQFASVRVLWEHTIKRVESEGGVALADEMREIRDRMKQIEKSVTGKRFRR